MPKSVRSVTIPDGSNETIHPDPSTTPWRFLPHAAALAGRAGLRVLLIESYGAGSHLRIARLLQETSRHRIDIIRLGREHWRTLALTGHRAIAEALSALPDQAYDLLIFSGPADVRLVAAAIPSAWRPIPLAVYFHESQWTYPAGALDRIPHLVNHLETLEHCAAIWFNSRYHRDTFFTSAWRHQHPVVRSLARVILPVQTHKSSVLYPPVRVEEHPARRNETLTIAWSARWEQEKRPDLMLAIMRSVLAAGLQVRLHILGCAPERWRAELRVDPRLREIIHPASGYLPRAEYEAVLAQADVWLSTAEHEYFGVAALEAVVLGAVPVVPAALAYAETLPSAFTYPPGNACAAAQRILRVSQAGRPRSGAWTIDARRFHYRAAVGRFDDAIERVVSGFRGGAQACERSQPRASCAS